MFNDDEDYQIRKLEEKLKELEQELAEAKEDTARLDWISRRGGYTAIWDAGVGSGWRVDPGQDADYLSGTDARAAIDEAKEETNG